MSKRAVAKVSLEDLSIHLLHRAVQRADDIFADNVSEANLTPTQYAVLVGVAQSADLSQTDLVEVTGSDQTTLSEVVRRLLKKGLLQRRRRKEDTRKYAVRLTEAGRQVLQAAEPRVLRAEVEVLARLTGNQRPRLCRGFEGSQRFVTLGIEEEDMLRDFIGRGEMGGPTAARNPVRNARRLQAFPLGRKPVCGSFQLGERFKNAIAVNSSGLDLGCEINDGAF